MRTFFDLAYSSTAGMSMAGMVWVRSMGPRKEYPTSPDRLGRTFDQPPSSSMYSILLRAQKSMQNFPVSVLLPLGLPAFHQSHMVLPGLIQEVSPMALGGFRLTTMFDSTSRAG